MYEVWLQSSRILRHVRPDSQPEDRSIKGTQTKPKLTVANVTASLMMTTAAAMIKPSFAMIHRTAKILTMSSSPSLSSSQMYPADGRVGSVSTNNRRRTIYSASRGPSRSSLTMTSKILQVDEEVRGAVDGGRPVVALESTIVAHGMPYPQNLELALEVESILREHDVVPATIAIRNGICRVGLKPKELEDLARAGEQGRADKCSTRDIPLFLARHRARTTLKQQQQHDPEQQHVLWGATTVAATMKLAHLAGISAFVTGGTGGVHRGGEDSLDISADLTELAQTPVVVVSAGVKSILDIQRTLEVLETNSIPTMGWQTDEFPAFFSPSSGVPCPVRVDSADFVADAYWTARELNMSQGMLVAVPNNDPAGQNVEENIRVALKMAEDMKIQGKDVTPFILKTVAVRTGGDSLRSNMHLVRQNARVGAAIAKAIADARPQ